MRNAQIAEWILSLMTSPEWAASTVGDLMENARSRGRFWLVVLRTAVSLLWTEFADDPANMMGLAFRGFLLELSMILGIALVLMIAAGVVGLFAGLVWQPATTVDSPPALTAVAWVFFGVTFWILVPFQAGRWMARRSPGRELAPCLANSVLGLVIGRAVGLYWDTQSNLFQFMLNLAGGLMVSFLFQIPMFAGAVWVRRKRLSH